MSSSPSPRRAAPPPEEGRPGEASPLRSPRGRDARLSSPEAAARAEGTVKTSQKAAYGLGHVLNDLCASMWFTYLLLFFHKVLKFDNVLSGVLMLVGQIADGLSTLFVGYFSDKEHCIEALNKYGKRKTWHLLGTVCVMISFPFIFIPCVGCSEDDFYAQAIYYASFVVLFQFGWAATQISHLSIIPDLTPLTSERGALTSLRYGATVASNITVYLVAWAFLGMARKSDELIGPQDADDFRNIMIVVVCLGLLASVLFHVFIREPKDEENRLNGGGGDDEADVVTRMRPVDWFSEPQFYQTALIYMTTRMFVNLTQGYIPLYLQITLQLPGTSVAIIPLVTFGFGFVTSMVTKHLMPRIGIYCTLFIGAAVAVAGCIWIQAGATDDEAFRKYEIYAVAGLVGIGGSILLITSLTLTAGLIGRNVECAAFVYGAMSLTDKFSNGLAFILIQRFIPGNVDTCVDCRLYFRTILFAVCGGAALLAALVATTMTPLRLGERWAETRQRLARRRSGYERLPGDDRDTSAVQT